MTRDRIEALRAMLARARDEASGPQLDGETFLGLRDVISGASGIAFDENARYIVERRVVPRLRALRLDDFAAYYRLLLYGDDAQAELERLLEAVTIRETYFFRERAQLDALCTEALPAVARETGASPRVWSAGCASGEEPYSVAMLAGAVAELAGTPVRVVGTDLVASAIESAQAAVYRDSALRSTPEAVRERHFRQEGPNAWRLDATVRTRVTFVRRNLLEGPPEGEAPFDVILCRNVLLYFGDEARDRAVEVFHEALRPGGLLLLGHAESLLSMRTPFRLEHLGRDVVYRR